MPTMPPDLRFPVEERIPVTSAGVRQVFDHHLHNSSKLVQQIHNNGYEIPFVVEPKLTRRLVASPQGGTDEERILLGKWNELVTKGIARRITDGSKGFYSPSFVIPKKARGEYRMISDLRKLNEHVIHKHFKIPGLPAALENMRRNDWMLVLDVENGYFNVNIAKQHTKFFRFYCMGIEFELLKLPMGFVESMRAFRLWLQPYLETVRTLCPSVNVFDYVDDVLCQLPRGRATNARELAARIRNILSILKLPLKKAKSSWEPRRKVEYLGFIIDTRTLSVSIPHKKARDIQRDIRRCLKRNEKGVLLLRHLASTLGKVIALLPACPEGRLHSRALYDLQTDTVHALGWFAHAKIHLRTQAKSELQWWIEYLSRQRNRPMDARFQCHEITICASDASDHQVAGVLISNPHLPHWVRRLTRREVPRTINEKELIAVYESILHFEPQVSGTLLNFRCDNTTVVAALNRWGSRQRALLPWLQLIFDWALKTNTKIVATYIATHSNTFADALSRDKKITTEERAESALLRQGIQAGRRGVTWHLRDDAFTFLKRKFRFRPRTRGNLTASKIFFPGVSFPKRTSQFHFPSLSQISRVLDGIERSRTTAVVLLPLWPAAPWFNRAARLAVSMPIILGPKAATPSGQRSPSVPSWAWIGFKCSGQKRIRLGFRRRLASLTDSPPRPRGTTLWDGVPFGTSMPRIREYLTRFLMITRKSKY